MVRRAGQRRQECAGDRGFDVRPPCRRVEQALADGEQAGRTVGVGGSRTRTFPSSPSPWRGLRSPTSTVAATALSIRSSNPHVSRDKGRPGHVRLHRCDQSPIRRRIRDIRRPSLGSRRSGTCSLRAPARGGRRPPRSNGRSRRTSRRRVPPRGGRPLRRSRDCWRTNLDCETTRGSAGATRFGPAPPRSPRTAEPPPTQPSSRRRTQTQAIRRSPASIPLVQCTPERKGFCAHQERR